MTLQDNFSEQFPSARIDPDCARELTVTSALVEYKGRPLVTTSATCDRCAMCVVAFAGQIGDARHMRDAANAFCAPGQR